MASNENKTPGIRRRGDDEEEEDQSDEPDGPQNQAPEQSDNSGKDKKKGGNRNFAKEIDDLRREVEKLKAKQLMPCVFCKSTGKRLKANGKPYLDDNELPQPCPVCKGTAKIRI